MLPKCIMLQGLLLNAETNTHTHTHTHTPHTHTHKYSLPVCQLPALHPGLVSHTIYFRNQCLSHNPPYDCANVLPYDVKNSWSRHHWAGLKGACGRWSLDYYWLKSALSAFWRLHYDIWMLPADWRPLVHAEEELSFYMSLCDSVMRELYEWHKHYRYSSQASQHAGAYHYC